MQQSQIKIQQSQQKLIILSKKKMSYSRKNSKDKVSTLQKSFIIQNAFKRNKRYLNMQKISRLQQNSQANRRRPFTSSSQKSINQKISNSFLNTTVAFSDKVQTDIDKFVLRMSSTQGQSQFNLSMNSSRNTNFQKFKTQRKFQSARSLSQQNKKHKIKGMSLDKYCSREQYYQSKSKPVLDQRLFNNFKIQKHDLSKTKDFQKQPERDLDFSLNQFHQLQYNTQKLYQQYYYKKTTMGCNFNYKCQPTVSRQIIVPKRPQDIAATQLSPRNVEKSLSKCTKLNPKSIQNFYSNKGRQLPCQLDMRQNTNLTNFWVDQNGKVLNKTKQYNLRRMKDDLVEKRIQDIKESKHPQFERTDLCDQKYFRVHH